MFNVAKKSDDKYLEARAIQLLLFNIALQLFDDQTNDEKTNNINGGENAEETAQNSAAAVLSEIKVVIKKRFTAPKKPVKAVRKTRRSVKVAAEVAAVEETVNPDEPEWVEVSVVVQLSLKIEG